ncbi:MAG TPA: sulfatase [Gemmatimonadales bacterium]|jgi:arylsulfatase A-like enzyme
MPTSGRSAVAPSALLPALWIGLTAGVLEVAIRACQHFLFGRLLFVGVDFWAGAPLVTAGLIAVPATLLAAPLARTRFGLRVRYGVPLGLGILGLILLIPGLAKWAALLFAAGLAVQSAGWLAKRSAEFERLVRRTLPLMLALPMLGAAGLHIAQARSGVPRGMVRAEPGTPNVLLLVLDTVRAIELGLYGMKPTTSPFLDALGAQGVIFDQAFSTAPWTAPSHASLFTGHRPYELSIDWMTRLDGTWPTLAEVLGTAGYATGGFVANTEYASAETGLGRGFGHYEDYRLTAANALRWTSLSRSAVNLWHGLRTPRPGDSPGRLASDEINRSFLGWLDRLAGQPFFAFLNYFDAHAPYFPPEPYWSRFLPGEPRRPRAVGPSAWSPQAVTLGRRAYQGAIAYLDEQIGALLDSLRVRGALRHTLVIVVGDHGEEFFEHGLMGHGNSLYAPSVRVPFLVVWPGHVPASRVAEPVSLAGIPSTVLNLLGRPGPFPGPGLAGYWTGQRPPPAAVTSAVSFARDLPSHYPVSQGALASARLGRYRFLSTPHDTVGQLYDLESDPFETRNLAGEPWAASILRTLRDTATAILPRRNRR